MSFNPTNRDFEIMTDGELANILSYFNPDFIMDTIQSTLYTIYRPYSPSIPNMVASYEMDLQNKLSNYPGYQSEINQTRDAFLNTVIRVISNHFRLNISPNTTMDLYSVAYYMYEFFISNFTDNMSTFLANFIITECDQIYRAMGFGEMKKSKDSSTTYAKKVFANPKLAIIVSKLDSVLNNICTLDIPLYRIIGAIYGVNTPLTISLANTIEDRGDFYRNFYCSYILNQETFSTMLTMIKLKIMENAEMIKIDIDKAHNEED